MTPVFRTLRWSAWLGWQIESNWTDPWRFAIYLLVKPFSGSLLLVAMYWAAVKATSGAVPASYLPFLYVSNACFMLVGSVTFGMSAAVISDRDHYGMLKYIRISPAELETYLIGRGLAKGGEGFLGALLTLFLGWLLFPEVRDALNPVRIDWAWLMVHLLLGAFMLVGLGLLLAGVVLHMSRHGQFLSEGIAGMIYLFSGVVFPVEVLPPILRTVSLSLPPTYWLEGMRRALLLQGPIALPSCTSTYLALILALSSGVLVAAGHLVYGWCEQRAWRLGRFDENRS